MSVGRAPALPVCPPSRETSAAAWEPTLPPRDRVLTRSQLQRPPFQTRPRLRVPGAPADTSLGDTLRSSRLGWSVLAQVPARPCPPRPWVSVPVSRLRAASCTKRRPALPAPHTPFTVPLLPRAHSGSRKDSGLGHCAPAARAPRLDPGYSCRCSVWLPAPGGSHPSACAQPRVRGAGLGPTGEVGLSTGTTLKSLLRMAAPAWRGTRVQEGPADAATRQSGQAPWDGPAPAAAAGGVGGTRPPPAPASGLPAGSGGA